MGSRKKRDDVQALSVSDAALCQRCPRLLAYRGEGKRGAWKVGIEGSGEKYGSLFHKHIAGAFFDAAADPNNSLRGEICAVLTGTRAGETPIRERLEELIRTRFFLPFLDRYAPKLDTGRVLSMARGTSIWAGCMADFLVGIPFDRLDPGEAMDHVFLRPERTLQATYVSSDGRVLELSGRYDALLFNPDSCEATLFEFKGYRCSDPSVALSQTLIYAWLIRNATGILPAVQVVYLEEERPGVFPSSEVESMMSALPGLFEVVLDVLERRLPLPVAVNSELCLRCPWNGDCAGDWGTAAEPSAAPERIGGDSGGESCDDPGDDSGERSRDAEGRERMGQLLGALKDLGLSVADAGVVCGPCFIRLKVRPDAASGTTVKKIGNRADDLQVQMDLPQPPMIQAQKGYVSVDVPRLRREVLTLEKLMRQGQGERARPDSEAAFPLGMRVDGSVFWADLSEPSMTSVLIGGTSGSGKSVLLRSVVVGLLLCAPQDGVGFTLIDPKRVTFTDLAGLQALEEGRVLCDADEAMEALREAVEEMEQRYGLMEGARVSHLTDYNVATGERLRRRVLIIDEYADLMTSKGTTKELELLIQRICQKGRAAGFHLLLATQRPDAKVVTGVIKANLQLRIALKVASKSNSQIILGEGFTEAQCLLGHGDMLVGNGSYVERLQAPLADAALLGREFWN